jgi:hypothetical protein
MEPDSWDEIEDKIMGNGPADAIRDKMTGNETIVWESDEKTTSKTDSDSMTVATIPQVQQDNNSDKEDDDDNDDDIKYKMSTNKDAEETAIRVIITEENQKSSHFGWKNTKQRHRRRITKDIF